MSNADFEPDVHEGEGCPVEALGRVMRVLWARLHELEDLKDEEARKAKGNREKPGDGMPAHPERGWLHADDRMDALRFALSCHRARSLAGCLYQVVQASSVAGDIYDELEKPDWRLKQAKRTLDRLLYPVAMHIEEVAGITTHEAGMNPVMSDYLNPWGRPEAAMARLRAEEKNTASERGE